MERSTGRKSCQDTPPRHALPRRDFIKKSLSLVAGLGALVLPSALRASSERTEPASARSATLQGRAVDRGNSRALVLITRRAKASSDVATSYRLMLDAAVKRLTGAQKVEDAWASLFGPNDVVALKVNAITGKLLSTSPILASAIADGLISAGVRPANIIVWDRTTWELEKAGFSINFSGDAPLCFGTDAPSAGYESNPTEIGSIGSCFSRIVTEKATALINVPLLREHAIAGASMALKNNYGAIHNPNKYHADGCSPFVADVNSHSSIKGKTRLNICDAMKVQFHSGPGYKPEWISEFGGIIVSTDPVALDTVGTEEIEKMRKSAGRSTLRDAGRYPAYLAAASQRGLGISERSRIDVINIEVA
jgi:uncharacterized protein (DUF362 family)